MQYFLSDPPSLSGFRDPSCWNRRCPSPFSKYLCWDISGERTSAEVMWQCLLSCSTCFLQDGAVTILRTALWGSDPTQLPIRLSITCYDTQINHSSIILTEDIFFFWGRPANATKLSTFIRLVPVLDAAACSTNVSCFGGVWINSASHFMK